jgi:small subunit ribosomal protein S6
LRKIGAKNRKNHLHSRAARIIITKYAYALCPGSRPGPFSPQGGEKGLNNYELMFIIAAALDDDVKEATVETVKEIISNGGEVVKTDVLGIRKLAYPIKKKNEGFYAVVQFRAPADLPKELDRRLRISENVIRHLIINKDEK